MNVTWLPRVLVSMCCFTCAGADYAESPPTPVDYVTRIEPLERPTRQDGLSADLLIQDMHTRRPFRATPTTGTYTWSVQPLRENDPHTRTFLSKQHRPLFERVQNRHPHALVIDSGTVNLQTLADTTPPELIDIAANGDLVLSIPLVVRAAAVLLVTNTTLKLNQSAGAFIVNGGGLYVDDATIIATQTADTNSAVSLFHKASEFRPFIVSWGGSTTQITRSRISHLGFQNDKAYGVTISDFHKSTDRTLAPVAWIEDTVFEGMYFGVYTYDAGTTVVHRNRFMDCIVYGIDPHDRSTDLWIVDNEVTGTQQKHGIILSREVDDAHLIRNRSHHNAGAGIMLDRSSVRALLLENQTDNNGTDGVAVYESGHARIINHTARGNAKHGIYVRNSADVLIVDSRMSDNGRYGLAGASLDLKRATQLDRYEPRHSLGVYNTTFNANRSGMISTISADRVALHRLHFPHQKLRLGGDLAAVAQTVARSITTRRDVVTIIEPNR